MPQIAGRWFSKSRYRPGSSTPIHSKKTGPDTGLSPQRVARRMWRARSACGGLAGSLSGMYTNLLMLRRAPERTVDERKHALEEANRVRFARAATKRDLKSGNLAIYDLLMDPSEELKGAKVEEMLLAVKGIGRIKVTRVMRDSGISRSKTLVGLTHGQRDRLIRALGCEEG